jgi:hypothetical protein
MVEPLKPALSAALTDVASNDPFTKKFSPFGVGDDGDASAAPTFTVNSDDAELVLPAASVAVAVKLWVAFDN